MATLDDFNKCGDEMLYYSNWMTKFRDACEKAGIDPDRIMEMKIKVRKRRKRR